MTTQPMSAEQFWQEIYVLWSHKPAKSETGEVEIMSLIEQRDQALTAPLMERIEELEKESNQWFGIMTQYHSRIRVLEEALKFYADKRNWSIPLETSIFGETYITNDRGDKARIALQTSAEGEKE